MEFPSIVYFISQGILIYCDNRILTHEYVLLSRMPVYIANQKHLSVLLELLNHLNNDDSYA